MTYIEYIHIERDRKRLGIPCQTWLENCAEVVRFWPRPGGSIDVMPLAELRKARSDLQIRPVSDTKKVSQLDFRTDFEFPKQLKPELD